MFTDCAPYASYPCAHLPGDDVFPTPTVQDAHRIAEETNRALRHVRQWDVDRFGDTYYSPEPTAHVCEWPGDTQQWHHLLTTYEQWSA